MTFVTHDEYRYIPGNYDENSDPDDEFETVEVIDAIIEFEDIKPLVRLVATLDKGNELHYWKEEYLAGCGWFHWDRCCGFVSHAEMVSYNI